MANDATAVAVGGVTAMEEEEEGRGATQTTTTTTTTTLDDDGGDGTLLGLLKRLELATSRLEGLAELEGGRLGRNTTMLAPVAGQDRAMDPPAALASSSVEPPAIVSSAAAPQVEAFQDLLARLDPFLVLSSAIDPIVAQQAQELVKVFAAEQELILTASRCMKPSETEFMALLKPIQAHLEAVQAVRDRNRTSTHFNLLATVAEGVPAVGWVAVTPKPFEYVKEMTDAASFYGNRVLRTGKESNPALVEWVNGFRGILEDLRKYVLKYHPNGLAWNSQGETVASYLAAGEMKPKALNDVGSTLPPPPPPPPPAAPQMTPAELPVTSGTTTAAGAGMSGVFADLNRGSTVTAGLKKVSKDQMTHKNPALRSQAGSSGPTTQLSGPKPIPEVASSTPQKVKQPYVGLEGSKWIVSNQVGNNAVKIDITEISQTVNIYDCQSSTIVISGKLNAVSMANCSKTSILLPAVIASIDIVKSKNFAVQVTATAPMIAVDDCDGGTVYLTSEGAESARIIASKSSAINVMIPSAADEGDYMEIPLPEQLEHSFRDKKLLSTVVEHAG